MLDDLPPVRVSCSGFVQKLVLELLGIISLILRTCSSWGLGTFSFAELEPWVDTESECSSQTILAKSDLLCSREQNVIEIVVSFSSETSAFLQERTEALSIGL